MDGMLLPLAVELSASNEDTSEVRRGLRSAAAARTRGDRRGPFQPELHTTGQCVGPAFQREEWSFR
jgi:hypothetical protein